MKPSPRALALLALACLALVSGQATSRAQPQEPSLPLDARHVMPLVDTTIQVDPLSYGEKGKPGWAVSANFPSSAKAYPWAVGSQDGLAYRLVWIDGNRQIPGPTIKQGDLPQTSRVRYPYQFEIPNDASEGRPVLVALGPDGKLIERDEPMRPYERAAWPSPAESLGKLKRRDRKDADGFTALHYAAANGSAKATALLLDQFWARPGKSGPHGMSPLILAAANGRAEALRVLLQSKKFRTRDLLAKPDEFGPMNYAAGYGHLDCLKLLREAAGGFDDIDGLLKVAIGKQHLDVAAYLFDQAPSTPLASWEGRQRAIARLLRMRRPDFAFFLGERWGLNGPLVVNGENRFHKVAHYADAPLLDRIAAAGEAVDFPDPDGLTPLFMAINSGNKAMIRWLLDKEGATPNTSPARSPLLHAIEESPTDSVAALLAGGLDPNQRDENGATALMKAALLQNWEAAKLIARAAGVWNPDSPLSDSALAKAITADRPLVLEAAFESGLSPDRLLFGELPIVWLAEMSEAEAIRNYLSSSERPPAQPQKRPLLVSEVESPPSISKEDYLALEPESAALRFASEGESFRMKAAISSDGRVLAYKLPEGLSEFTVKYAAQWLDAVQFEPARHGGEPVPVALKFRLPPPPPKAQASAASSPPPAPEPLPKAQAEPKMKPRQSDSRPSVSPKRLIRIYQLNEVDRPPDQRSFHNPIYPYDLKKANVSGSVTVEFVILPDGSTAEHRVVETSHHGFNWPAIDAIKKSTWSPGMKNGQPVPVRVAQEIRFNP